MTVGEINQVVLTNIAAMTYWLDQLARSTGKQSVIRNTYKNDSGYTNAGNMTLATSARA
jgi:hypothetical protein